MYATAIQVKSHVGIVENLNMLTFWQAMTRTPINAVYNVGNLHTKVSTAQCSIHQQDQKAKAESAWQGVCKQHLIM